MGAGTEGRINKMAEGQMRLADSDITQKASNITYQSSNITRMGDSVGRYSIGETGVNRLAGTVHKAADEGST
jgi:hypothetical protein